MPSPIPESGSTSVDKAQQYKSESGCSNKECNTCSGCGKGMKDCNCSGVNTGNKTNTNNQVANINQGGIADLSMTPWTGLNLDQLRMEWSGTDPSSKEYTIATYLPQGLNPQDISVSVDERNRMLTMQAQTRNHQEQKDESGTYYATQDSASFTQRSFTLPDDVDISGIKATKNTTGGFSLHLPKAASGQLQQQQGLKQIAIQ